LQAKVRPWGEALGKRELDMGSCGVGQDRKCVRGSHRDSAQDKVRNIKITSETVTCENMCPRFVVRSVNGFNNVSVYLSLFGVTKHFSPGESGMEMGATQFVAPNLCEILDRVSHKPLYALFCQVSIKPTLSGNIPTKGVNMKLCYKSSIHRHFRKVWQTMMPL